MSHGSGFTTELLIDQHRQKLKEIGERERARGSLWKSLNNEASLLLLSPHLAGSWRNARIFISGQKQRGGNQTLVVFFPRRRRSESASLYHSISPHRSRALLFSLGKGKKIENFSIIALSTRAGTFFRAFISRRNAISKRVNIDDDDASQRTNRKESWRPTGRRRPAQGEREREFCLFGRKRFLAAADAAAS